MTVFELTRNLLWNRLETHDGKPIVWVNESAGIYRASFQGVFNTGDDPFWIQAYAISTIAFVSAVVVDNTTRLAKYPSLTGLRSEPAFYWDNTNKLLYIHLDNGEPPELHDIIVGRLQGFTNQGVLYIDDLCYEPLLVSVPAVGQQQDLASYDKPALVSGDVVLNNTGGDLDDLIDDEVYGNDVAIAYLDGELVVDGAATRLDLVYLGTFYVDRPRIGLQRVTLKVTDPRKAQNVPLPAGRFNQTDYPNLEDDLVGDVIPLIYGDVREAKGIPVTGKQTSGAVTFRVAETMTSFGTVQTLQDDVWVTETPTGTDLPNGEFTLAEVDSRNASGGIFDCKIVDCEGIPVTYASDVIKDLFNRILGIPYNSANYDTTEWAAEEVSLAPIGVVFDEELKLFEAIHLVQSGSDVGFRFEYLPDGRRTIRVDDWERTETWVVENVELQNLTSLEVDYDPDLLTAVLDVGYQKSWESGRRRHHEDDSELETVLARYRQQPRREVDTLLSTLPDAQARATYEIERFSEVHGTVPLIIMGSVFLEMRVYDVMLVELNPGFFDRDYGNLTTKRDFFRLQRGQIVSVAPDYERAVNHVKMVIVAEESFDARITTYGDYRITTDGDVRGVY